MIKYEYQGLNKIKVYILKAIDGSNFELPNTNKV